MLCVAFLFSGAFFISLFRHVQESNKPFLTILQINDVYELNPVAGLGGVSRVGTLYQQLLKTEKNVLMVLAGDFYSPSALGVANVQLPDQNAPQPLHGRQMVDVLNSIGVPPDKFFVTFGNHEFDLTQQEFLSRIQESNFTYIASNVSPQHSNQSSSSSLTTTFPSQVVPFHFMTVDQRRICVISVTISNDMGDISYASILSLPDSIKSLHQQVETWKSQNITWDVMIAITHHAIDDDAQLADEFPFIDIIMGGHEHENWQFNRGTQTHPLFITKADSNAKTAFVHRFYWHPNAIPANATTPFSNPGGLAYNTPGLLTIDQELVVVDATIPQDETVQSRVDWWVDQAFQAFAKQGLDPSIPMCQLTESYNAQDKFTRARVSPIGAFLADANLAAVTKLGLTEKYGQVLSIINIGSIRIDDLLPIGTLIQYDALRILPFGGVPVVINVRGDILERVFNNAVQLLLSGMWMGFNPYQIRCSTQDPSSPFSLPTTGCTWMLDNQAIDTQLNYTLLLPNYCVEQGWASWFATQNDWLELERPNVTLQEALITHFNDIYPFASNDLF